MLLPALYSDLWLFYQLYSQPCHIYKFIPYQTFDTFYIYSNLANLFGWMSHASCHKPHPDVQPSDQTCQEVVSLVFQISCNPTRYYV